MYLLAALSSLFGHPFTKKKKNRENYSISLYPEKSYGTVCVCTIISLPIKVILDI